MVHTSGVTLARAVEIRLFTEAMVTSETVNVAGERADHVESVVGKRANHKEKNTQFVSETVNQSIT